VASGFRPFVWTLVDSDYAKEGIPTHLVEPHLRHFVIYCTFPRKERWSRLHKTVRPRIVIMNPWKWKEILRVWVAFFIVYNICVDGRITSSVSILPPGMIDEDRADRVFTQLGPTPRLCIDYLCDDYAMKQYEEDVRLAISDLTTFELIKLFRDPRSLSMDAISHKICLLSRKDRENVYSLSTVSPITSSITSRLANHFRTLDRQEQIRLYEIFFKVPDPRVVAGVFFEAAAQRRIQDGVELELIPMVRLPSSRRGTDPQFYSSHVHLRNSTLDALRLEALQHPQVLRIPKCLPVEYSNNGPSSIEPDVIYVPESSNQVALDSFIIMDGNLYMLQVSIAKSHSIKPSLVNFISRCPGLPSMDKWHFIFIHPPNHMLVCPQPQRELRNLHPYSVVFPL
jgi:hypothetical protein